MNRTHYNKVFWMTAAALSSSAVPASAEIYLTEAQALGVVLGDKAAVQKQQKALDPALRKRLEEASSLRFPESTATFFIATQDGKPAKYAIVMNEIGKSEPITFMVGITPEGKVTEVVIMEFRENRGWEVKEKRFLNQFRGKTAKSSIRIDEDIINYTGATLSSKAVARGVKRALLLLDTLYPGEARYKLSAAQDFALPSDLNTLAGTLIGKRQVGLYRQTRYAMGTHCEIRAWCSSPADAARTFDKGFRELERIEQVFSAFREDSELSQVNQLAANANVKISNEFFEVAQVSVRGAERTAGAVNFALGPVADLWKRSEDEQRWPTDGEIAQARELSDVRNVELRRADNSLRFRVHGVKLDFGGIAKGYAAEKVGEKLEKSGVVSALVSLGRSSIYATKVEPDELAHNDRHDICGRFDVWPLAILQPCETRGIAEILLLEPGETVSTSGTAERGFTIRGERLSHVLDPQTGLPVRGARSATVIGRSGVRAEVASKALLLAPRQAQFLPDTQDKLSYWLRIDEPTTDESA